MSELLQKLKNFLKWALWMRPLDPVYESKSIIFEYGWGMKVKFVFRDFWSDPKNFRGFVDLQLQENVEVCQIKITNFLSKTFSLAARPELNGLRFFLSDFSNLVLGSYTDRMADLDIKTKFRFVADCYNKRLENSFVNLKSKSALLSSECHNLKKYFSLKICQIQLTALIAIPRTSGLQWVK